MKLPLAKNITRYFSLKVLSVIWITTIVISSGVIAFALTSKQVIIDDNGKCSVVKTMKTTVKQVLDDNRVIVSKDDFINLSLDSKLQKMKRNEILIRRAVPITVFADGKEISLMTGRETVKDALENSEIKLSNTDKLENATRDDKIIKDMKLKLIRVKEDTITEKTVMPYTTITRDNNHLDRGIVKTVVEGKEGLCEKVIKVVYEDGKEIARQILSCATISNPVNKVVECGTIPNIRTSRGDVIRYKKVLNMRATAYTSCYADTGKSPGHPEFGITYTGVKARRGMIAVDPRVIPLGSRVYIEGVGNVPSYGYAIAADIGGKIKGDLIDLYFDDYRTVNNWGCKRVKVYIL